MALNWNKEITLGGAKEPDRSAAAKVAQQGDEPTVPSIEDEIRDLRTDPTEGLEPMPPRDTQSVAQQDLSDATAMFDGAPSQKPSDATNGANDISWQAAEGIDDMRYGAEPVGSSPSPSSSRNVIDLGGKSTTDSVPASESEPSYVPAHGFDFVSEPASSQEQAPSPELGSAAEFASASEPEPVSSSEPAPAPSFSEPTQVTIPEPVSATIPEPISATIPEPVSATIPEPVSATLPVMPAQPSEPAGSAEAAADAQASQEPKKKKGLGAILNQPIGGKKDAGGTGKRHGRGRGSDWPSKKTINLYVRQESSLDLRHAIPLAIGLVVLLLVFLKFGILDPLARVAALQGTLSQRQVELQQVDAGLTDYDKVKDTYDAYNVQTSSTGIDVLGTLNMVDTYVKPVAVVESEDLEGNVLTLGLSGANLDAYGNLATTLMAQSNVSGVSVSTADSKDSDSNENVKATLTVTLRTIAETNAQEAQADGSTAGANAVSKDAAGSSDASASSGAASTSSNAASTSASTSSDTSAQSDAAGADATSN